MSTAPAPTAPPRQLGFWMCTALVVGNTIGMGIFLLPASLAPHGLNATIGWLVVVVGCLALARVFSELARLHPDADGPYGYIRATLGDLPAFLAMWSYWVSVWITNATLATGVVGYASAVYAPLATVPPWIPALALVWLFVAINCLGARTGGGVQVATSVLKLVPMLAIAALGVVLLATSPATLTANAPTVPFSSTAIMAATTTALFAMLGFESATVPAGNVVDPARTIPRATMIGTILVSVVYLTVSTVPMLLIPGAELAESGAPFALVMDRFATEGAGRWLALFVVISGLGCLNGWTLVVAELTRTLANNGTLPPVFARANARRAPVPALLLTGALASAMVAMNYNQTLVAGFTFLTQVVTAANLPVYALCATSGWIVWRRGTLAGTAAMLLALVLAVAFIVVCVVGMGREAMLLAVGLAAAGLPVYALVRARRAAPASD